MNILDDSKLLHELNTLRNENSSAYLNLKRNISAAYQMYYMHKAEGEFNSGNIEYFRWYKVTADAKEQFAKYCGVSDGESIKYFIVFPFKMFCDVAASFHLLSIFLIQIIIIHRINSFL